MKMIFGFLASAASIYSILLFIRIIMSWFNRNYFSKPEGILYRITEPYLDFWRRTLNFRLGFLDFSVLVAIASLSVLQSIFYSLSVFERITLGNLLAIVLMAVWSVASFILGFCIIIIVLRIIAYAANRDMYSPFWKVIDTISQPLLFSLNRIFFGGRAGFVKGMIFSCLLLAALWIGGRFAIPVLAQFLTQLPL